ncbi:Glycosyltransferase involved in cell wall bisynthesis [Rheinheimera pacifica]|uniref:Glycosyltransferase involved in cell wall bisynthesis n=1 Tax=Rheinheimera pacifica TaxID=173990 RepID=A0A1H6MZP8_9GAMM|nr:glycosyltransferase [Rheinheimera pacifica]SEI07766.1 Glycosyltransferase involved in cell wall bisynthesis [Rheinheimera pacifica]
MPEGHAKIKVLHFVTGGFSGGATQVAISLVRAALASEHVSPLLVLRRKRRGDPARIAELQQQGIPLAVVPGWSKVATIWALIKLCKQYQPDILVAHGFSEHLWGRYAGLLAKVPKLVHVEHNTRERYNSWRLAQSRWLSKRTAAIVGCSEGVRSVLLAQGMPAQRTYAISNGINTMPFLGTVPPLLTRAPDIVMVSRFSKQKDHGTLFKALALLKTEGLLPKLYLAGGGKSLHRKPLEKLAEQLGITGQVHFLGVVRNVPELLQQNQLAVLSSHYEGMPLALLEGMAAGCIAIGTKVPGIQEVLNDGQDGFLVAENDVAALAAVIRKSLAQIHELQPIADAGRQRALTEFSRERMNQNYEKLFLQLVQPASFG